MALQKRRRGPRAAAAAIPTWVGGSLAGVLEFRAPRPAPVERAELPGPGMPIERGPVNIAANGFPVRGPAFMPHPAGPAIPRQLEELIKRYGAAAILEVLVLSGLGIGRKCAEPGCSEVMRNGAPCPKGHRT